MTTRVLRCFGCGEENPISVHVKPPITVENGIATCSICGTSWDWPPKYRSE